MAIERHTPEQVADDFLGFEAQHVTLTPGSSTPINFTHSVRAVRIKNWDVTNPVLVKDSAISSSSDTAASRVGVAPATNVPNGGWYPYTTKSIFILSAGASTVTVEGWF